MSDLQDNPYRPPSLEEVRPASTSFTKSKFREVSLLSVLFPILLVVMLYAIRILPRALAESLGLPAACVLWFLGLGASVIGLYGGIAKRDLLATAMASVGTLMGVTICYAFYVAMSLVTPGSR